MTLDLLLRRPRCAAAIGIAPLLLCVFASITTAPAARAGVVRVKVRTLAKGLPQQTKYVVQEAAAEGPTVMVVGGVHGDEPAGAEAAKRIAEWPIERGRLVVLPEANVLALAANKRYTPGVKKSYRDLNRNFPKESQAPIDVRGDLASMHWELVRKEKPDWLVDLHEGFDYHQVNDRSVGSTIIVFPSPRNITAASIMIEAVNKTIDEPDRMFVPLIRGPADGSLSRAAAEHLGTEALIAETTNKDQPLETRVQQHEVMVQRLLEHLRMVNQVPVDKNDINMVSSEANRSRAITSANRRSKRSGPNNQHPDPVDKGANGQVANKPQRKPLAR